VTVRSQQQLENERMDQEATQFAMELLMPEDLLRAEIKKMGGINLMDARAMKKLSDKFRVDVAVMAIRIGQLMERK